MFDLASPKPHTLLLCLLCLSLSLSLSLSLLLLPLLLLFFEIKPRAETSEGFPLYMGEQFRPQEYQSARAEHLPVEHSTFEIDAVVQIV